MHPLDPATVRLVTARFGSLQGLRLALNGAAIMLVFGGWVLLGGRGGALPAAIVCVAQGLISAYANHHYETRFGVVEQDDSDWMMKGFVIGLLAAFFALVYLVGANAGLLALPFAAGHAWIVVRDFPRRTYHLIGTAGASLAGSLLWMSGSADTHLASWALPLLGASMILPGLLDHRQLVQTLRGGATFRQEEDIDSASSQMTLRRDR